MNVILIFAAMSLNQHLPAGLLESVCYVESGHNEKAYSPKDGSSASYGICQVKQATCREVGIYGNLQNPVTNIDCASRVIARQYSRYGTWTKAVCAYNRGKCTGDGDNAYTRRVWREWDKRVYGR